MILITKNYHLVPFYMQTPNQMNISECMLAVITNDYVLACSMLAGFIAITYLALSYARVSYMPKTPQWLMSIIVAVAIAGDCWRFGSPLCGTPRQRAKHNQYTASTDQQKLIFST
ncbi:hypothetical protein [Enterovibrio norvegicus]|uniref:hypothetical protein n=1 Tax=Enterovibrio norvegicus TaxID=188144 RepID=UPI00352D3AD7